MSDSTPELATTPAPAEAFGRDVMVHVAALQLEATGEGRGVLQVVTDVLLNFVGATRFAIFVADPMSQRLRALRAEGLPLDSLPAIPLGQGGLGEVAAGAPARLAPPTPGAAPSFESPPVAFALRAGERVVGAIAIWALVPHKSTIEAVDRDLFQLLGVHAGSAIESARLTAAARAGVADPGFDAYARLL